MPDDRLQRVREAYPIKCKQCDKEFTEEKEFKLHIMLEHRVVDDERRDD